MLPQPLHPALVHFPIVFGMLLPVIAIVAVVLIRRGASARASWLWAVLVSAALAGSAWLAVETGQDQEDVVERVVSESTIHDHEEAGELFFQLSALSFLVFAAGLAAGRIGAGARYASVALALGLVVAGYRVGGSGGDLVYEHGAASAYATASARAGDALSPGSRERGEEARERRERDDDDRR